MQWRTWLPAPVTMALLAALAAESSAASFDCGKANSRIDKIICSDENLSRLDDTLATEYKKTLSLTAHPDKAKLEQRAWVKSRNACADRACVEQAYRARIEALRSQQPQAHPEQSREPRAYQPYAGEADTSAGNNENGDPMFVTTAVILDHDNFRLVTNKGDFFWAPWMAAKKVDAMERMAAGLKGREARITYSKGMGKSETTECTVEGIARNIGFFGKHAAP